ncbi:MAG: right-handed parallel beta-helix repeat-containing protein [Fuerstiella sp.]
MSSVRDFGAVGDGVVDDTDAIQHALNDGDGLIEFPRGEYLVTRTLVVDLANRGRTSISGLGTVGRIVMAGPGPALLLKASHTTSADPLGFRPEEWQNERMPTIDGLEIVGQHPEADGIRIEGVMQPTLSRVLIRKVRTAVHVTKRARNLLIDACQIYENTGIGVHLQNVNLHQCIISDSHISYCRRGGIRIEDSEVRNLQITGNDIEYNNNRAHAASFPDGESETTAEIYIDVVNGSVREGTIASNTIQATYSSNGSNIRFIGAGPAGRERAGMWTITGNLIGSQNNNIHLTDVYGVNITGNYVYSGHHRNLLIERCRNIVIGPNSFGHNADYQDKALATGIRLEDSSNCNLSGLLIQDAPEGRHTVANTVPISRDALVEIVRCRGINMTGCQILDGTPIGLLLDDCTNCIVSSCTILDQRDTAAMKSGVVWNGTAKGSMLCNVRIGGSVEAAVIAPTELVQSAVILDD